MQIDTSDPPQPLPPALSCPIPSEQWSDHQPKDQYLQEMMLDLLPQNLDVTALGGCLHPLVSLSTLTKNYYIRKVIMSKVH